MVDGNTVKAPRRFLALIQYVSESILPQQQGLTSTTRNGGNRNHGSLSGRDLRDRIE